MTVFIVISKLTGHIMAVYTAHSYAYEAWKIALDNYDIREFPVMR